jgi:hypothetical protein
VQTNFDDWVETRTDDFNQTFDEQTLRDHRAFLNRADSAKPSEVAALIAKLTEIETRFPSLSDITDFDTARDALADLIVEMRVEMEAIEAAHGVRAA